MNKVSNIQKKHAVNITAWGSGLLLTVFTLISGCSAVYAQAWVNVGSSCFSLGQADYTSIAVDTASGTPYVFYRDWAAASNDLGTVMKFTGGSWVTLDSAGAIPGYSSYNQHSIAIDTGGTPYVVFSDNNFTDGNVSVMKYNGSTWEYVGSPGFSSGSSTCQTIAIGGNGKPFVFYGDGVNQLASVMKYNGTNWEYVGSQGFSDSTTYYNSIAIITTDSSDTPYVAYGDGTADGSGPATVMKFNGSWVNVGSAKFSAGEADYTSIAIGKSDTPYVVYEDYGNGQYATVMKFNGSSWVNVGSPGFSAGTVVGTSIAIDRSGTPYVVYGDAGTTDGNATVMKYTGSKWINVGSAGFSADRADNTSIALDSTGTPYVGYSDYSCSTIDQTTVMKPGAWLGVKNTANPVTLNLSVIPNPAHGAFTLNLSSPTNENAQITFTNILGQNVKEFTLTTNRETLVQFNLPPGVYFLSAVTVNGSVNTKMVVE